MSITTLFLNQTLARICPIFFAVLLSFFFVTLAPPSADRDDGAADLARARLRMVEKDIIGRGIRHRGVIEAMGLVPRHLFVPDRERSAAYQDRPLPIGEGQTISQPYMVALMTELLELKGGEKVLEVGTGSGYQAAVLSLIAKEVYTIEIIPSLAERANTTLMQLGYKNVSVKAGDGFHGWKEKGPFDAILVTAAAAKIPEPLWQQLKEGGRLIMPLGPESKTQRLIRARKLEGKQQVENITGVIFVPMTGTIQKEAR